MGLPGEFRRIGGIWQRKENFGGTLLESGRREWVRFTPEDHRVEDGADLVALLTQEEEPEEGENTSPRVNGVNLGGVAGLEYSVTRRVALDLSALYTYVSTEKVENLPETAEPPESGGIWSVRFGVRWTP